jgi:uncharacterized protein (DUF1499 family)
MWMKGTIALALVVAVLIAVFFALGPQRVWRMTTGDPDMGRQSLDSLQRTGKPNDALFVPAFADQPPDSTAIAAFQVDADTLFRTIIERIDAIGTVEWVEQDAAARYARGLTFSPMMGFPDTNHIWVVEGPDGTSGLYLYAAAKLGQSDLGKNAERMQAWLALLDDLPRAL